jgi:hypothetical protein
MKRIMKEFRMTEISAVNRPAQQGARAVIMKADAETKTENGKSYPASDYAYVPDKTKPSAWKLRLTSEPGGDPDPKIVGAAAAALGPGYRGEKVEIPDDARDAVVARVRAAWRKANPDKTKDDLPEVLKGADIGTVAKSVYDMVSQPAQPGAKTFDDLMAARQNVAEQFEVDERLWPFFDALGDSIRSIVADGTMDEPGKINAIRQSIDQFTSAIVDAVPDAEAEIDKVFADPALSGVFLAGLPGDPVDKKETFMSDDTKKVAELEKQLSDMTKRATDAESKVADLTKAADVAKSDETFEAGGVTIHKSEVGEGPFKLMKSQQERIEISDFEKAATSQVPNLPGETVAKAKVLRAVAKMDKETADALNAMLKAGNEAMAKMLKPLGNDAGRSFSKAEDELDALAKAYAEKHSVTYAKAYDAVLKTEDGRKLYGQIGTKSADAA